jgi:hypothetical protein
MAVATGVSTLAALTAFGGDMLANAASPADPATAASPAADHNCQLRNGVQHMISIQFDNVHLTRNNPNVPSDLEQMPNLLNFLTGHGTVLSNAHDVLVHTATNFTSNQTGLYPDRTDVTQSNSFKYYDPNGATHTGVSFAYWTDPLYDPSGASIDPKYNMDYSANRAANPVSTNVNTPAPWVAYTRAGCNVGEVGMANTVLENIATDIPTVFGANSPQQAEATANPTKANADFVGLAVHCAHGSATCVNGQTDPLPDEPGGYHGYQALFGNSQVAPAISPSGPVTNLTGSVITDGHGNNGFPGFDSLTPNNSLAYAAAMEEHGVPVVNAYVSDAHSDHTSAATGDLGPGQPTYEQQLHDYDAAFGQFLSRLAADGITPRNTLFSVTTDEGDHFSGSAPTPANCTGAPGNTCSYATRSEVNVNLPGLLATQANNTTPFAIHADPAPALWVTGNPAPSSTTVRTLGRDISNLTITNPLTGATEKVANQIADPVEEKILHFVGADAARRPTLTFFSSEDQYVGGGAPNCTRSCVYTSNGFAWNHGGLWPDMSTIWLGLVGPGVANRGMDTTTWADQTDNRPTLLALAGLHDDYQVDGRVLVEDLKPSALPVSLRANQEELVRLGAAYKQILAAQGRFARATLTASTHGIVSGSTGADSTYQATEQRLSTLGNDRDRLAAEIQNALLGAEFGGNPVPSGIANTLTDRANDLLVQADQLAGNS